MLKKLFPPFVVFLIGMAFILGGFITSVGLSAHSYRNPYKKGAATLLENPRIVGLGRWTNTVVAVRLNDTGKIQVIDADEYYYKGMKIPYWRDLVTGKVSFYPNAKSALVTRWDSKTIRLGILLGVLGIAITAISFASKELRTWTRTPAST